MSNKKKNAPIVERDLMVFPPAIPFHPKPKKKADDEKEDETKTVTFKVTVGRGEDETNAQKTEWSFRVFEDGGDAEDKVNGVSALRSWQKPCTSTHLTRSIQCFNKH